MSETSSKLRVCICHGEPRDGDRGCAVKRRERQRRYWLRKGWGTRRERRLEAQRQTIHRQLNAINQEAEDLGLA